MSKKKPIASGSRPGPGKAATPKSTSKKPSAVAPWPVHSDADGLLRKIFWGMAALMLGIMLFVAPATGVNGDDEYQNDYSQKLVAYYSTMGRDTSALFVEKGNMHYYGGFFDLLTGATNAALGFEAADAAYHQTRHIFNAIFGFAAMVFIGLLAREIAGWRAALLALTLAFLSPRFFGHSMMNPKDIPFAAGFAIALFFMVRFLKNLPSPNWKDAAGLVLGIALAFATRAGGLLLIAYLGLFAGLDFLGKFGIKGLAKTKTVGIYAAAVAGVAVAAYVLAILSWPAALADPIGHPFKALSEFSQLGVKIRLLFQGENIMSDSTPWYYPVVWIAKTIPLSVLFGLLGAIFIAPLMSRRWSALPVALVLFAAMFPVFYIIYKDSILHDGWRHLMFVYPGLVVCASLFWIALERLAAKPAWGKYAVWGALFLTTADAAAFIARNPTLAYVYFNPIGGGLKGAFGNYETDYWGVSVKQALDWMEEEGILGDNMKDTVVIGTTFFYPVLYQTAGKYRGMVKPVYVRFGQRYTESWDYGIFPSRFFRGPHLRAGTWPNSKTVHVVRANGVPIAAIEKDMEKFAWQGEQASKNQEWDKAISSFRNEVSRHKDNELAWQGLANAYLNKGQFADALSAAEESLKIAPDNEQALFQKGLAHLNAGDLTNAAAAFERNIEVNEESYIAHYYLGLIYQQNGDLGRALKSAIRSVELNGRFKQGYELAAALYEQQGDTQTAAAYRNAAAQL